MKNKSISLLGLCLLVFLSACADKSNTATRKYMLHEGWNIQSSANVKSGGEVLSTPSAELSGWYPCRVPSTVMGALTANGEYQDLLVGENYKKADKSRFESSWWFRNTFKRPKAGPDESVKLCMDGISYAANIWLNGVQIATRDEVFGPFRLFEFDITPYVKDENVLAVEVFRARAGEPNIGFVDWNPRPLDESMGIFREVYLATHGKIDMKHSRVLSRVNTETLEEAWLSVETRLINGTNEAVSGKLTGELGNILFTVPVTLEANEEKLVFVDHNDVPGLHMEKPRLWWCNNLGSPELYELKLTFRVDNVISDEENITFGIREIRDYYTEEGFRGFTLNGKRVLIKSAGWTDDIFLRDTERSNEIQVKYVKDMNLNSIRFENIWGNSRNIYDLCDRYGILALVGWSCHWEWEEYLGIPHDDKYGAIISPENIQLIAESFKDQILWLRNHPGIICWFSGSDKIPHPDLEKKYMKILEEIDDRPYINSAGDFVSEVTGPSGMKMAGPYDYVAPNYWYVDTIRGGAYGFNTETGIGAQLPVYESVRKMIPQDELWPVGAAWNYHCTASQFAMNNLDVLTDVINKRYGEGKDLDDYLMKAHLLNYEGTKAMFEAFRANVPKTTGIVQWMLNSAWPSLYWQLYDYYLIPTSAYYAVKKANLPQQLIYNYKENAVYAVNEYIDKGAELKATVQFYSTGSDLLLDEQISFTIGENQSVKVYDLGDLKENGFLCLKIMNDKGDVLADNFYWLSKQEDVYDWDGSNWYMSAIKIPADFKGLGNLAPAQVQCKLVQKQVNSTETELALTLENTAPSIAFFLDLALKDAGDERIFPVFWEDNYISLLPGEKRTVKCSVENSLVKSGTTLSVSGRNVGLQQIKVR